MAYPMYQPHIDFGIMQMQECTPGCILLILSKLNIIPKIRVIPYGMTRIFYVCGGTRTIKCKCPVDICSIPVGRNRHHNVTSPTTGTGS